MALASQPQAGFQPPAYIANLIASINDGARAAQTGGLFMLAIAVYLMATVISTTDEVLLRGTFVTFQQIGLQVPVVASYALAPLVFLFLYVHTLIRYDMLAENLRLLDRELRTALPIEADRDRCRQLLANVEFVQYWIAPKGSPWHSRVYPVLVWVMLVAIPIVVFLATQISFLRYQSAFVTYVIHLGTLAAALSAITYFWYRQARRRQDWRSLGWWSKAGTLARSATGWFAAVVLLLAVLYLRIPPPDSTTAGKRVDDYFSALGNETSALRKAASEPGITALISASGTLADRLRKFHPLDLIACANFDWGCRFLRLDHRLLVQEKPEGEVLFQLRTGDGDLKKLLLRIEALFLRDRNFRFADFSNSEFYDADLAGVDLRGADLSSARLQGADLSGAELQGADLAVAELQGAKLLGAQWQGAHLSGAHLRGANLSGAEMQGAILYGTHLQGAHLSNAALQGADLFDAELQGANLFIAELQGARLSKAKLQGADLISARLQGADLSVAELQGAVLSGAALQGAELSGAALQGANLFGAQLQGADLRFAALWQAHVDDSNLSLADLRGLQRAPVSAEKLAELLGSLDGIPENRRQKAVEQVTKALTPAPLPSSRPVILIEAGRPALVDAEQPDFAAFGVGRTTDDEEVYDTALAPFLADLARSDVDVARRIARRALSSGGRPDPWPDLAQRLLAMEKEGAVKLDLPPDDREALEDVAAEAAPPPPVEGAR